MAENVIADMQRQGAMASKQGSGQEPGSPEALLPSVTVDELDGMYTAGVVNKFWGDFAIVTTVLLFFAYTAVCKAAFSLRCC